MSNGRGLGSDIVFGLFVPREKPRKMSDPKVLVRLELFQPIEDHLNVRSGAFPLSVKRVASSRQRDPLEAIPPLKADLS